MRLIKLSRKEFDSVSKVDEYFKEVLPARIPPGKFRVPSGWIADDGISSGELLLFSYLSRIRYVAFSVSSRHANHDDQRETYPYFFEIDMASVRSVDIPLKELQDNLFTACGVTKNIMLCQGWPKLPDDEQVLAVVDAPSSTL